MSNDTDRKGEPFDAMAEHDKVIRHIEDLSRKGMLNDEELENIEGRIREITERQKKEHDRRNEDIRERYATKSIRPTKALKITLIVMGVAFVGAMLEVIVGRDFIFIKADEYRAVAEWVFVGLLPFVALTLYRLPKLNMHSDGFLSRWIIRPVAWFGFASMVSYCIVVAPLGYIALAGVIAPGELVKINATVVHLGPVSSKRGAISCGQSGTMKVAWGSADICVDDWNLGNTIHVYDDVVLLGKRTVFGFKVEGVEVVASVM